MIRWAPQLLAALLLFGSGACGTGDAPGTSASAPTVDREAEVDALSTLLDDFLAGASVDDAAVHDRFWADDLVYTSSNGTRRGKAEIMAGLTEDAESEDPDPGPSVVYTAEDVEIDVYGTTAVVAFRLVGTPQGDEAASTVGQYFNTGTFLKRDGRWEVVAWQATQIPEDTP